MEMRRFWKSDVGTGTLDVEPTQGEGVRNQGAQTGKRETRAKMRREGPKGSRAFVRTYGRHGLLGV